MLLLNKGVKVVKEKVQEKERLRKFIIKIVKALDDIFEGSTLFGSMFAAMMIIAVLMGGAAEITANVTMNEKAKIILASDEFKAVAGEGLMQLNNKLAEGKIDKKEYDEGVEALQSIPAVIDYMQNADDAEFSSFLDSYNGTKKMSEEIFTNGLPKFAGITGASFAVAAASKVGSKKAKKKLESGESQAEQSV